MDQVLNNTQDIQPVLEDPRFRGIESLYSFDKNCASINQSSFVDFLASKTVMVIGIGGVGSWSCEMLVRSGIKKIILVIKFLKLINLH